MKYKIILLLFLLGCSNPVSHKTNLIKSVVEPVSIRTDLLPRIIVEAKVLSASNQIEPTIILDFTDYARNNPMPTGTIYSVTMFRQSAPNYFYTVVATMFDKQLKTGSELISIQFMGYSRHKKTTSLSYGVV
jgi:hypothetical protein